MRVLLRGGSGTRLVTGILGLALCAIVGGMLGLDTF
jgi:hypothetical protein